MHNIPPLALAQELVAVDSVTSHSNAASLETYVRVLHDLGFDVRRMPYRDFHGTDKVALEAIRLGGHADSSAKGGIGYFCHNDVVSVEGWDCPHGEAFSAAIANERLWGRGSCDMKGSAAAALSALSSIPVEQQKSPFYFFVTGDEECGMAGAELLVQESAYYRKMVDHQVAGIIGEPTELNVVNSHKGGCHIDVTAHGVAAHSSTIEGKNANWQLIPFLTYLHNLERRCRTEEALQNQSFNPPTLSLNVVVENQPAAANITVGQAICRIFFRPMPDTSWQEIAAEIEQTALGMGLDANPLRQLLPMHTDARCELVQTAMQVCGNSEPKAVCYATDACCFEELSNLIVLGPGSIEQAHRSDEFIAIEQLTRGQQIFTELFRRYGCS